MCVAVNFANEINKQIAEAKEYYNKLRIKEKVFNDVQQDILHKIEDLDKFSLYVGWKFCMSLNKLRKVRRKTKNELKTMEVLITQLGDFSIKETKIDRQSTSLEQLNYENGYHKRQLEMTGDILKEVDNIINNVIENNHLTRTNANKIHNTVTINKDGVYNISDSFPKIKGSTIKVKYKSNQQKQHLVNKVSKSYRRYEINENEKYIELINKKNGIEVR